MDQPSPILLTAPSSATRAASAPARASWMPALRKASELTLWEDPRAVEVRDGQVLVRFPMPRQSVSLLRLEW